MVVHLLVPRVQAQTAAVDFSAIDRVIAQELTDTHTPGAAVSIVAYRSGASLNRTADKAMELLLPLQPAAHETDAAPKGMTTAEMAVWPEPIHNRRGRCQSCCVMAGFSSREATERRRSRKSAPTGSGLARVV
jgi:hypothetical protein